MKLFLIKYRRSIGTLESCREFDRELLPDVRAERLALEIESLRSGGDLEVVVLEAPSVEALHLTHGRYFKTLEELLARPAFA
jgi:hypothetical protein